MKISWDTVVTNVISTFFAAIIVSAAALGWKGAMSVDTKIKAYDEKQVQQEAIQTKTLNYLSKSTELFESEFIRIGSNQNDIAQEMQSYSEEMQSALLEFNDVIDRLNMRLDNFNEEVMENSDDIMLLEESIERLLNEVQGARGAPAAGFGGLSDEGDFFSDDFDYLEAMEEPEDPNIIVKGVGVVGKSVKGVTKGVGAVGRGVFGILDPEPDINTNDFIGKADLERAIEEFEAMERLRQSAMEESLREAIEEVRVVPQPPPVPQPTPEPIPEPRKSVKRFNMPEQNYIQQALPDLPSF